MRKTLEEYWFKFIIKLNFIGLKTKSALSLQSFALPTSTQINEIYVVFPKYKFVGIY